MDFRLTDEQRTLQESARGFARTRLPPVAAELERNYAVVPDDLRREYGKMGFLGVNYPKEYGGLGFGKLEALIVLEEFARISPAVAFPVFEALVGPSQTILHHGPEWMKRKILPKVTAGEMMVAASLSEPDVGSALTDMTTRAVTTGGKIVINGTKRWLSGGGTSQGIVLYCRLTDKPGAAGIGAVYIEKDLPGVRFGAAEQFVFNLGVRNSELYLENVTVPVENIVVPAPRFKDLIGSFNIERLGNATMGLGVAQAALDLAMQYTEERKQFGKPLCEFQAVQLKLADMAMDIEASRLLIHRAAFSAAAGLPSIKDSSMAKAYANEAVRRVTAHGLQVMGAMGLNKAYAMERLMRDSWVWGIGGGHIDLHKINVAGELMGRRFSQR
jgi:alkylation response protein AidB-like acyl-CoA dehydrogenase